MAVHPLFVALNRFGLGAKGAAALYLSGGAGDPRAFVLAELKNPPLELPSKTLPSSQIALQTLFNEEKAVREACNAMISAPSSHDPNVMKPSQPQPNIAVEQYRAEALVRFQQAMRVPCGFVERLTAFWANHFAVSCLKAPFVRSSAGAFEREAIRPHVLGRFKDMLRAVEGHPAMLFYLDNAQSVGPNSVTARTNPKKGLNENLAREILELHTLGVRGGYTQNDVKSLAQIITGWTYAGLDGRLGQPGTFAFAAQSHEPGPQTILRHEFQQQGIAQGEAALSFLASHAATGQMIATKLVRAFIADDPPPTLVARLAKIFRDTDGDLGKVSFALASADEAWTLPLTKMRSPREFLFASWRLLGRAPDEAPRGLNALSLLGEPLWSPSGPNGFPDTSSAWSQPEQIKLRLELAAQMTNQLRDPVNPADLLDEVFGTAISTETRDTVRRAETKQQGLALLLMSPEMQRR